MTQRIFDTNNAKDMKDLWDILPECVTKIGRTVDVWLTENQADWIYHAIKIDFHDREYIIRPVEEATEADVGKLCKFWSDDGDSTYGILSDFIATDIKDIKYGNVQGHRWPHARRLTKEEIEDLI